MGLHVLLCKYRELEERMSLSIRELVAILLESSELHSSDKMGDRKKDQRPSSKLGTYSLSVLKGDWGRRISPGIDGSRG